MVESSLIIQLKIVKDNLNDCNEDYSEDKIEKKENNFDNQMPKREDAKLAKKTPEIKIENNNTIKNKPYDMPRVSKISYNNLINFHDEKREIEGKFF